MSTESKGSQPDSCCQRPALDANIAACEMCGGAVIRKKTLDGSRYLIPVKLDALLGFPNIDFFIFDRLQRAERIIEELREQLHVATTNK